jgi:hypothetical protein
VRRTRLTNHARPELWPNGRHLVDADRFQRQHATIELALRDLEEGLGLEHCPSGHFFANVVWLTAGLGEIQPGAQLTVARTVRTRGWRSRAGSSTEVAKRSFAFRSMAKGIDLHYRPSTRPLGA